MDPTIHPLVRVLLAIALITTPILIVILQRLDAICDIVQRIKNKDFSFTTPSFLAAPKISAENTCPKCGASIPSGNRFCGKCGAQVHDQKKIKS